VLSTHRVDFAEEVVLQGPGVVALDGDRDHKIKADEQALVSVRRDGPRVLDVDAAMRWAVAAGMMAPAILTSTHSNQGK